MIPAYNLHTHTNFSDGKNSAEEMLLAAIALGMKGLGFSEHSPSARASVFGMRREDLGKYREEILRLKEKYADRIHVLLGIEQDSFSGIPTESYDYVIGSVHYVPLEGEFIPVDLSAKTIEEATGKYLGGDLIAFCRKYYEQVATVVERTACDIVGHFDLVTKFNEAGAMFDEGDYRYRRCALEVLDALLEKDVRFEINTGAIARGYRRTPYPSPWLLRRIAEKKGRIVINSDSHSKETLQCFFGEAVQYARACGVGGIDVLTNEGWRTLPL